MMHAKTFWVLAVALVCWGSAFVEVMAAGDQVEKIQRSILRHRSEVAAVSAVSAVRANHAKMKTVKGSAEVSTIRQNANSSVASTARVLDDTTAASTTVKKTAKGLRSLGTNVSIIPLPSSSVAGTPGTTVYLNDGTAGIAGLYTPGAGERIADDIGLAGGGCAIVHYSVGVAGFDSNDCNDPLGEPLTPFDVALALWDGDPCLPGSSIIPGSESSSLAIPSDCNVFIVDVTLPVPAASPDTIYLAAIFSTPDSGWVVTEEAEIGNTNDFWSEDNIDNNPAPPDLNGCFQFFFGSDPTDAYAGFFATVNCNLDVEPEGACCDGDTCSSLTEALCPLGNWKGAFTGCDPSPCLAGACCSGETFGDCLDVTEAQCSDGIFRPGALCSGNACTPTHQVYANTLQTFTFTGVGLDEIIADDIRFLRDTPCELVAYEMLVAGGGAGPTEFNVELGIWTNKIDPNNPDNEIFDLPDVMIPGSEATFLNVPADGGVHRLLVSVEPGIILDDKIWVSMTTNTPRLQPNAGPLVGGPGKYNDSLDAFSLFNSPSFGANVWQPGIFLGGYDPNFECDPDPTDNIPPDPGVCPSGSLRIKIYCDGNRPIGACCNGETAGCTDGVRSFECDGRFLPNTTCAQNLFDPPCGTGQCCSPNPFVPDALICSVSLPDACAVLGGVHDSTKTCLDSCPTFPSCVGSLSSCFEARRPGSQDTGCNDVSCCERVCNADSFCCTTEWDQGCAETATSTCDIPPDNDDWLDATPIAGEGTFAYDNSLATLDGPSNVDCTQLGDIDTITNDLWFCWEAPCNDTVFFKTCEDPVVSLADTKIAVYGDCATPPDDLSLNQCDDDTCLLQSQVSFNAIAGQSYLLRVGTFPGQEGEAGNIEMQCGAPARAECSLGVSAGDCCDVNVSTGTPGCSDESCCRRVCACDSFCCDTEWDTDCAANGFNDSGCGAATVCTDVCGGCPAGSVDWLDPLQGTVDAGIPHDPNNAALTLGIDTIQVNAPVGAGSLDCWTICETADDGSPNSIINITDNGGGDYTIHLARPITTNAATTIDYAGDGVPGVFISHPGNSNGDGVSSAADVLEVIDILNGDSTAIWGSYSSDIDRSGSTTPPDILRLIDLFNGAGSFDPWLNTPKPSQTGCP